MRPKSGASVGCICLATDVCGSISNLGVFISGAGYHGTSGRLVQQLLRCTDTRIASLRPVPAQVRGVHAAGTKLWKMQPIMVHAVHLLMCMHSPTPHPTSDHARGHNNSSTCTPLTHTTPYSRSCQRTQQQEYMHAGFAFRLMHLILLRHSKLFGHAG